MRVATKRAHYYKETALKPTVLAVQSEAEHKVIQVTSPKLLSGHDRLWATEHIRVMLNSSCACGENKVAWRALQFPFLEGGTIASRSNGMVRTLESDFGEPILL